MSSFFIPQTVPTFGDSTLGTYPLLPCFNSSPCPQCPQPTVASDTRSPVLEDSEEPPRRSSANSAKDQEGVKRDMTNWVSTSLFVDLLWFIYWSIMIYHDLSIGRSTSLSLALDGPQPSNEDAKRNNRSVDLSWSIYLMWSYRVFSYLSIRASLGRHVRLPQPGFAENDVFPVVPVFCSSIHHDRQRVRYSPSPAMASAALYLTLCRSILFPFAA